MPTATRERRGGLAPVLLAALAGLAIGDAVKPPPEQWSARLAIGGIDAYRATLSRVLERPGLIRCRYNPSCSAYGREAIRPYGLARAGAPAPAPGLRSQPF